MAKKNIFTQVQMAKPPKSVFDLSHDVKMTLDMGKLYPTMCMECVPGDRFNIGCESLLRFAPLLAPVMHRIDVYMHYFFVPNRLVWDGWEDYITQQPYDGIPPAHPFITIDVDTITAAQNKWIGYFGLPDFTVADPGATWNINPIPFAAYQLIYQEYYRDQNLIDENFLSLVNGDNTADIENYFTPRIRAWEHDYFTSALPFAQKGASVDIPLGNVLLDQDWADSGSIPKWRNTIDGLQSGTNLSGTAVTGAITLDNPGPVGPLAYDPDGTLSVGATTINDLRRAFRLQEWYERQARGGTRYIEVILAHFNIKSSDARLQRPEYITGTKSPVSISEVLNTTGDTGGLPQGNMAGHAISVTSGKYGSYFCEEHGYIIGIMSVMPKTAYQDGIPKHFLKINDPFDYYWPEFANIGEQAIQNQEVMCGHSAPGDTFGYIPRYAEYKFMNSRTAGDFRSSLHYWTLTRQLGTDVDLNQEFIECVPTKNIFAVTTADVDSLYAHVYHKIRAVRSMPFYGTPSF